MVGTGLSEACRPELDSGMAVHKDMVVMPYPALAMQLQPLFGSKLVVLDPANPDGAEIGIVQRLKTMNAQRNAKKALLALGALTLGLLFSAPRPKLILNEGAALYD